MAEKELEREEYQMRQEKYKRMEGKLQSLNEQVENLGNTINADEIEKLKEEYNSLYFYIDEDEEYDKETKR